MTAPAWIVLGIAAVVAAVDWWAVSADRRRVEHVAKPAVLVLLIAVALLLEPGSTWVRALVVVGLVLGLVGDVALMLDRFIPGAAAFLLGHVAYIAALAPVDHPAPAVVLGIVIVAAAAIGPGRCIVRGAFAQSRILGWIVAAYLLAIGSYVVLAVGSWSTLAGIGALVFLASDALLAWNRFVGAAPRLPVPHGDRVLVMVTYHLGQALLVLALPGLGA